MQRIIEKIRNRGYERYEAHRRFEEATDIAERIGYPIDHTVHYEMRGGFAYGTFDTKDRPFREQTEQSLREGRAMFTGANSFEVVRREHEHQEALLLDRFGRGELLGNVLVKVSPVPDAVRSGTAEINGYRRDLLRSFVRVYYRTDSGFSCRLFSLDQSDPLAMAAVGDFLGIDIEGRASEDVLGDHVLVDMSDVSPESIDELVSGTRLMYDRALELQTGMTYFAGSRLTGKEDALSLVMGHSSLLDEHMREIAKIMNRVMDPDTKKVLLDERRKRTTAAIDLVLGGATITSGNDASVGEQMASKDYGADCPTGVTANTIGMSQGSPLNKNRLTVSTFGECQACLQRGVVGECSVCFLCEEDDNRGVDLMDRRKKALARRAAEEARKQRRTVLPQTESTPRKVDIIQARYGRYAKVSGGEKSIGGQEQVVVDRRNGQVLAQL